eukprot:3424184-Rhodomonas_salina.2
MERGDLRSGHVDRPERPVPVADQNELPPHPVTRALAEHATRQRHALLGMRQVSAGGRGVREGVRRRGGSCDQVDVLAKDAALGLEADDALCRRPLALLQVCPAERPHVICSALASSVCECLLACWSMGRSRGGRRKGRRGQY